MSALLFIPKYLYTKLQPNFIPFGMDQSLVDLVHSSNLITRPLGLDVRRKVRTGETSPRLYLFLAVLWADWAYSIALSFIPTENEELLLKLGEFPFHLVDQNRYFMTMAVLAIRTSSVFQVTIWHFDNFNWIREASVMFEQLKTRPMAARLSRLRNRCRLAALLSGTALGALAVGAHAMSTVIYHERNSKYSLGLTHIYIFYYDVIYTFVNGQFLIELYFLCNVCIEVFNDINQQMGAELHARQHDRFGANYTRFSQGCIFAHHVLSYCRKLYIAIFVCNSTLVVFVLYSAMYANPNLYQRSIYLLYLGLNLFYIVFFSHTIGLVDVRAKQLSDRVYQDYIVNRGNKFTKHFYWQLLRYFQSVWSSTISMEIMGSAINSSTSIMILTILLTVFAFLVGNFHIKM